MKTPMPISPSGSSKVGLPVAGIEPGASAHLDFTTVVAPTRDEALDLVEAAWHHRSRYQPGKTMRDRWDLAGPAARARGDQGHGLAKRPLPRGPGHG